MGLGNVDLQGWRLGVQHKSRQEISVELRQLVTNLYTKEEGCEFQEEGLRGKLKYRAEEQVQKTKEYRKANEQVKRLTDNMRTALVAAGLKAKLPDGYSHYATSAMKNVLREHSDMGDRLRAYETALYDRMLVLRRLRARFRSEALSAVAQELADYAKDIGGETSTEQRLVIDRVRIQLTEEMDLGVSDEEGVLGDEEDDFDGQEFCLAPSSWDDTVAAEQLRVDYGEDGEKPQTAQERETQTFLC